MDRICQMLFDENTIQNIHNKIPDRPKYTPNFVVICSSGRQGQCCNR